MSCIYAIENVYLGIKNLPLHLFSMDAGESQTFLDWKQRLQIALDAAVGEDYGRLQKKNKNELLNILLCNTLNFICRFGVPS